MIVEKFRVPVLVSELNYRVRLALSSDNYANSSIYGNLNFKFSKAVKY